MKNTKPKLIDHELAREWHPTLNKSLILEKTTTGSPRLVWWLCKNGHEFQMRIADRVRRGTECPQCRILNISHYFVSAPATWLDNLYVEKKNRVNDNYILYEVIGDTFIRKGLYNKNGELLSTDPSIFEKSIREHIDKRIREARRRT